MSVFPKSLQVGGPIYSNTVAVALLAGLLKVEKEVLDQYLSTIFQGRTRIQSRKTSSGKKRIRSER